MSNKSTLQGANLKRSHLAQFTQNSSGKQTQSTETPEPAIRNDQKLAQDLRRTFFRPEVFESSPHFESYN